VDSRSPAFAEDKLRGNDEWFVREVVLNGATTRRGVLADAAAVGA